jgi:hypothetical protein
LCRDSRVILQGLECQSHEVGVAGIHRIEELLIHVDPTNGLSVVAGTERQTAMLGRSKVFVKDCCFRQGVVSVAWIVDDTAEEDRGFLEVELRRCLLGKFAGCSGRVCCSSAIARACPSARGTRLGTSPAAGFSSPRNCNVHENRTRTATTKHRSGRRVSTRSCWCFIGFNLLLQPGDRQTSPPLKIGPHDLRRTMG